MKFQYLFCGLCLIVHAETASADSASKSSTIATTPDGLQLVVVNTDSNSVTIVDLDSESANPIEIFVGNSPQTVAVDSDGVYAFIPNRFDDSVSVLDLQDQIILGCIAVDDEPFGVVAGQQHIFVSNQGSNSISVIDRKTYLPVLRIATEFAPRGLALSDDGSQLYVTHFFSGKLSIIDIELMQVTKVISVSSSANISQSVEIDSENALAYLPQTLSNSSNEALLFDTTVFPVVSVVDLVAETDLRGERIAVDIVDEPVGIPIDAVRSPANKLYLVNAASNDVSVIDLDSNTAVAHLEVGDNPRGIVLSIDGTRAYINNSLAGTVSVIDTMSDQLIDEFQVSQIPLESEILNGKKIFNSSNRTDLARDQWISCATCHFDGEHDARTWFFADGPRNTPSLLGVSETLPIHWSGDLDELHDVESTIRNIQAGTGLITGSDNCDPACDIAPANQGRSDDLDDLARYMETLTFTSDTSLDTGGMLSVQAQAGNALFNSAQSGCSTCHQPPLYTDRQQHDVGTGDSALEKKGLVFDTPSLRGIKKTAPYLHDGSAASLSAVLVEQNPADLHGVTSQLSATDIVNLVAFLTLLPTAEAGAGDPVSCVAPPASADDDDLVAVLELSLNHRSFSAGDALVLKLNVAGAGVVDIYSAIRFPDGSFVTLGETIAVSALNQVLSFRGAQPLSAAQAFPVVDVVLPEKLALGVYTAFGVVVRPGFSVLDSANWISMDEISFEVI